jgi:hypothetical protein
MGVWACRRMGVWYLTTNNRQLATDPCLCASAVSIRVSRQVNTKRSSLVRVILRENAAAVGVDDGARNGKTESHSVLLCGEERFEEL